MSPRRSAQRLGLKFGLTGREAKILNWVAQGKTNSEVGTILGISQLTVKKHLEKIHLALGMETRTAAAAIVLDQWPVHPLSIERTPGLKSSRLEC